MSEKKASKPATGNGVTGSEQKGPEEIREEIEETREELGDTVAAVTEKTDVKKQTKAKVEDVKAQAASKADEAKLIAQENPAFAIAGAVIGLLVLWRLLRR